MWKIVTSKFDIEEHARKWVLQTICSCWRTHKCRLKKKYFKPNMTENYNLKNQPPNIPLEQWKIFVKFWKSDLAKARSKKNKDSREKQTTMHTTGSKPFADIHDEETNKNPNGREPSRVQMYIITHKPKHGKPMNEGTMKVISELEETISLHPEALEQSTAQDDIFSQVLGKDPPGRVRTYGKGVVPSDLWGSRLQLGTQKMIEEVKRNAQKDLQNIQAKMQEEMQVKLQEQVEAIKSEMLGDFKIVLNKLQKCFPGIVIPDLSSMSIPNINEGEAAETRASVVTHQVAPHDLQTDEEIETAVMSDDYRYKKKEKKKMFGRAQNCLGVSKNASQDDLKKAYKKLKGKKTQGLVKNVENHKQHEVNHTDILFGQ